MGVDVDVDVDLDMDMDIDVHVGVDINEGWREGREGKRVRGSEGRRRCSRVLQRSHACIDIYHIVERWSSEAQSILHPLLLFIFNPLIF